MEGRAFASVGEERPQSLVAVVLDPFPGPVESRDVVLESRPYGVQVAGAQTTVRGPRGQVWIMPFNRSGHKCRPGDNPVVGVDGYSPLSAGKLGQHSPLGHDKSDGAG
ncbi:hypothetical protein GCM10023317_15980 [Actinopolymorpha pittospori]